MRWLLIFWTFVIAAVSYMDRTNIAIATVNVQAAFGLSDASMGTVFLAFGLGYAFTQPFAGRIADRVGAYKLIAIALLWWSVFTALTPLVPSSISIGFGLLIAVRLILGIGEAVIFPASNRLIASWIPTRERGLANGVIFAGVGVGAGVTTPAIRAIIQSYGWPGAFYFSAAVGLVVLVIWLLSARDRPNDHPWVTPAELAYITAGLPAARVQTGSRPVSWGTVVASRHVLLMSVSYFAFGYVAWIYFTWFFKYMTTVRHLDLKARGYVYEMLPFIAMALASAFGGLLADWLCQRFGRRIGRCTFSGIVMILAAIFVAVATQVDDVGLAAVTLAGGAGALYLAQSAFWALSADFGGASAGSVSGFMNMCGQIGGVITAQITPVIATGLAAWGFTGWGWNASFLVAAVICFIGGVAWFGVDPDYRLPLRDD